MTPKQRSLLILGGLLGFVLALVYLGVSVPRESFEQECARSCKPKAGVVERSGPDLGRSWRPAQRNVVCVCR
jgi:hypothetical protein